MTNLLKVALATGAAVALYGVAERLGIDKHLWVQDVQNRVFSTLGQPNWLAAYLVALIPITMGFSVLSLRDRPDGAAISHFRGLLRFACNDSIQFALWNVTAVLFFLVLLFTRSRSGLFGFFIADLVFWGLTFFTLSFPRTRESSVKKDWMPDQVGHDKKRILLTFLISHLAFIIIIFFNGTYIDSIDRWTTLNAWKARLQSVNSGLARNFKEATPSAASYTAPLLETGGTESGTIRKYVWQGAMIAWKSSIKTFLVGTGTETFAFAFFQFRPTGHNMTSEWDFLYNKAHNEYLNYLATTGIFGLGSYLLFIVVCIWTFIIIYRHSGLDPESSSKSKMDSRLRGNDKKGSVNEVIMSIALFAGWTSILVTNFFGFSVVIVQLFLFLFPAMIIILAQQTEQSTVIPAKAGIQSFAQSGSRLGGRDDKTTQPQQFFILLTLLVLVILLVLLAKMWYADTLFASGYRLARAGQYAQAQPLIRDAITLNGGEPLYHDEDSITLAALTTMAVDQQQATLAATLAKQALTESDTAIGISPKNVNFWKSRTKIFYSFAAFDPQFNPASIQALTRAWDLSPNDPKILYNLAILYGRQNDNAKAIELLQKAIAMKPNYRDAYFALNIFYQETRQSQKARDILSEYLQKVDPKDQDFLERIK